MPPVLPPTRTRLEGPVLVYAHLRLEDSSSGLSSTYTNIAASIPSSTTTATLSIIGTAPLLSLPKPTHPIEFNQKDTEYEYVTLSVILPYTTYITTVLLGDSFPTSSDLVPTIFAVPTSNSSVKMQTSGIGTGTIVGIVVGVVGGFLALFAVFYVYLLRARQIRRRRRRRRRSRRGSSATAEGAPPPPPPPGGPPGPGPGPPPPPPPA